MMHRCRRFLGRFSAVAVVCFATSLSFPFSATAVGPPPPVPSSGHAYFGARAKPKGNESEVTAINHLEQRVGRKFAIAHYYVQFGTTMPTRAMIASADAGRYPFVDLDADAHTWPQIASGATDSWLIRSARNVARWGRPCLLNFDHEPESYGGTHGTRRAYIRAWKHVVRIFRTRGVTNCSWVWILQGSSFSKGTASRWYPGDSWVDWVASDAYNWYPGKPGSSWRKFSEAFAAFRSWATLHPLVPAMVAETGVQEDPRHPLRKANWYRNALDSMKQWRQLRAFVYFNSNRIYPWWVTSSTNSLRAFREIGSDPYFSPMP